ncbi:MAG TPA: DNA-processing protein DprA, partial [Thermomicrobiales bacterium]|nr:DNA-processing protein DprA [Thermomicrobiales bacterium]
MVTEADSAAPDGADADADAAYWMAFRDVSGIGPVRFERLLARFGTMRAAWKADPRQLASVLDRRSLEHLAAHRSKVDPEAEYEELRGAGIDVLTLRHEDYPDLLREIPAPPPVIFLRGKVSLIDRRAVAIVGTRRMSPYGREMARSLAWDLAQAGVTIVSGLAKGIDGVAHASALDAGGRTIAVMGNGVKRVYPAEHRSLAARIATQGAVLSDFHPDAPPDGPNFPARNRIISGLSLGVIVVEAPMRSGALITVDFAADQGREVFAVPGSVLSQASAGCHGLIREGARLVRSADDVLEDLRLGEAPKQLPLDSPAALDESSRRILAVLTGDPRHIDEIAASAGISIARLSSQL